ncbi:MAG: MBL fold metallo-hydrolase [Candidatus Sumerlaeia bacterium]|nr:MBL fold metallo-hydrolase [Candidatus Sumerlaeia bacterium]
MKMTFWGAASTTTGSLHLLEHHGKKIALDCGLFQGRRAEYFTRNKEFPCDPSEVSTLILSHAHIDHTGNVPNFVKQGFKGDIICTHATADLVRLLLLDSAHIQEKDIQFVNKKRARRKEPPLEPLYTIEDAEQCLDMFVGAGYYRPMVVDEELTIKFLDAGHILGSSQIQVDLAKGDGAEPHRLVYSGDIGRSKRVILRNPETPSEVDTLIMESTYGSRESPPFDNLKDDLRDLVNRVAERGGKIIVPAFSVGRTQQIVYQLNVLFNEEAIPRIPIYVDSPLSTNVTAVFRQHPECFNRQTRELLQTDDDVFGFDTLTYIRSVEESIELNKRKGPFMVISASGMCEAGRILHHLRNAIGNPNNCILICGYQAEHTLGRRLVEKQKEVRIFGETHELKAEVKVLNGFSGHADKEELREYAFRVEERSGGRLRKIYLVHGEEEARKDLAEWINTHLKARAILPQRGESFDIN